MLLALVLTALGAQKPGPVLPPSCSPTFQSTVINIEQALQHKDLKEAGAQLSLLPKPLIRIQWDDHKAPEAFRQEFRKAGQDAIAMWAQTVPAVAVSLPASDSKAATKRLTMDILPPGSHEKPDIRVSFEPVLGIRPNSDLPAGCVGFFSTDPSVARLDFVIGLQRGKPLTSSGTEDVFSDVAYAIGMYLGVADGPFRTYAMDPTDLPRSDPTTVSGTESNAVKQNFKAIAILQDAVNAGQPLAALKPSAFVDPLTITSEPALQGDRVEFHIQISNRGDGTLLYSMHPDCGCTLVSDPGKIDGVGTQMAVIAVDTMNFSTAMTKHVTVYTNDPLDPVRTVTMKIPIKARYRIITPLGETVVVPDGGLRVPIYLIPAPGSDLEPVSTSFQGLTGKVSFAPWTGTLADPDANEGPKLRKGYKFVVAISGDLIPGRSPGTLQIYTTNPEFPSIVANFYAQRGIIAQPDDLSLGAIGRVPMSRTFTISRPGIPFKVLGVRTNSPNLTATSTLDKNGDYYIKVDYDGKARKGDMLAAVLVKNERPQAASYRCSR